MSAPAPRIVLGPPNTPREVAAAIRCVRRHAPYDADDILAMIGLAS